MAHELAHVKHRDILTNTIAATLAGAIAMVAQMGRYSAQGGQRNRNPITLILIMVGAPLVAMLIRMAISRAREFAADRGGAEISNKPLGLANALHKLHQGVQKHPLARGNPAHAHMFIINPFLGGLQRLFTTHPPTEERIISPHASCHVDEPSNTGPAQQPGACAADRSSPQPARGGPGPGRAEHALASTPRGSAEGAGLCGAVQPPGAGHRSSARGA